MFALLKKLFKNFPNLNFGLLLTLLKVFAELQELGIPNIKDETAFKKWVTDLLVVLEGVAKETATTFDDTIVSLLTKAVNDQGTWDAFYSLLNTLFDDKPDFVFSKDISTLTEKTGINPATILLIAKLIMTILNLFKKDTND